MANITAVPDFTDAQVRDEVLPDYFSLVLKENPFMQLIPQGRDLGHNNQMEFEYPEEIRSETVGVIALDIVGGDTENLTVVSSSMFTVQDTVWINLHTDTNGIQVTYNITSIPDATHITCAKIQGATGAGSTPLTHTDNVIHLTNGIEDNDKPTSTEDMGGWDEPTMLSNNFQTLREDVEIGKIAQRLANLGMPYGLPGATDLVAKAVEQALYRLQFKVYQAMMFGVKRPASSGAAKMEGFIPAINTTGNSNRKDAGGNVLTENDINDLLETMTLNGLLSNSNMVAIMHPKNARVLSALKLAKVEYDTPINAGEFGTSVQKYNGELLGTGVRIVVDNNMVPYMIPIMNMDNVEMRKVVGVPVIESQDATVPGQYGDRIVMRTTMSQTVQGRNNLHGIIHSIVPA